ncbi:MAG: hypothetical protein WDM80_02915 [Limisphaerales bacterium]
MIFFGWPLSILSKMAGSKKESTIKPRRQTTRATLMAAARSAQNVPELNLFEGRFSADFPDIYRK